MQGREGVADERRERGGIHYFRVTTLFAGDRFCTPNYGVRLCISSATAATKKRVRPTDSHLHDITWGAISPPIALITHIAPCPTIHPAAFRRPFSVIRGFSPHPDDRRFKWMTGGDRRAEQRRGGGLWAPKITRLRPVLQWARPAGRCSWWCYGLICVCLSPIFSILSFFDWLEQWMDVGLEGGLIPSCEAKIGVPDNGSKTEPIVKCDSLIHDLDAFRFAG